MSGHDAAQALSFFHAPRRHDHPIDSATISQLRDEAEQVKKTIHQLETQLQMLADHLEALQDDLSAVVYPINTLPAEVLCHIFAAAVSSSPSIDVNRTLLQITTVCQRWRRTAIADPHLWTRISYSIDEDQRDFLSEHFLRRARALPIVFSIPADDLSGYKLPRCIFDSASQWEEASLSSIKWPFNWATPNSDTPNAQLDFPLLTKFSFDVWSKTDTDENPVFMNAPSLRELSISIHRLVLPLSFPAHQLRKLTILRPATYAEVLALLTHQEALEELSLPALFEETVISDSTLQLPRLSTLSLVAGARTSILDHLRLPALTTLHLSDLESIVVESSIDPCIRRSAATVTSLSLFTPTDYVGFRALSTSYMAHQVKHLTVTAFPMPYDEERKCSATLADLSLLSSLESFTLVIPPPVPAPVNIRPFLDGIAMRAAKMCPDGVQRQIKLARLVIEFAPYGIPHEEDIRALQHLQKTFGVEISMPNGHPMRKSWRKTRVMNT
ncbi:F-box domain-containing protein [Mycena indigotica]|uniref:F-box domain-containing protein n=1 Tax=Mycena indigotica TaxID=2126181 RepID=A0A8H6TAF9_9AGAR|nr:F-box domain-containing protein [Mycena indigotica]KAF7314893.1 F-box domain-containing protein [Mycena indigotica]